MSGKWVAPVLAVIVALAMGFLFENNLIFTIALVVIALGAAFYLQRAPKDFLPGQIGDPPLARFLFASGEASLIWLPVRLALGWVWLTSGWGKLNNPNWMNGTSLLGFWSRTLENSSAGFDWYTNFLQSLVNINAATWFGPLVAIGELAAGIGLILGLFTGIAAFGSAFLNLNFMLAGTAGVNPLYFLLGIFLILAWRNAGWIGLDRWVLPRLGVPWNPGTGGQAGGSAASPPTRT